MGNDQVFHTDCATIDFSRKQLLVQTTKDINPTKDQINTYLDAMDQAMGSFREPFAIITLFSRTKWAHPRATIHLARGVRRLEVKYKDTYRIGVLVDTRLAIRIQIPLFNFFSKPLAPQIVVKTIPEALEAASFELNAPLFEEID